MEAQNLSVRSRRPARYIFPAITMIIPLTWAIIGLHTFGFSYQSDSEVFYPLLLLLSSENLPYVMILLVGSFTGLAIAGKIFRTGWIMTGLIMVIGFGIFALYLLPMTFADELVHQQTITFNSRQYHLVQRYGKLYGKIDDKYTILQCNNTGLVCNHYSTPYIITFTDQNVIDDAYLMIDNGEMYLQIGDERIPATEDYS